MGSGGPTGGFGDPKGALVVAVVSPGGLVAPKELWWPQKELWCPPQCHPPIVPPTCVRGVEDGAGMGAHELLQELHVLPRGRGGRRGR